MKKRIFFSIVAICVAVLVMVSCASRQNQVSTETNADEIKSNVTEETIDQTTKITEETNDQEQSTTTDQTDKPIGTNVVTGEPVEIKLYEITITYVFSDGTRAAPTRKALHEAGTSLHVESPEIEGYEPNLKYIEWSSISREKVFRVVYSPISGEITETNETE